MVMKPYIEVRDDKTILHFEGHEWLYMDEQDWFEWTEPITGTPTRIDRGLAEMLVTDA